ncbi:hypothetical protein EYC59_03410 [Candidatus Saccharibacteria bacterium]|nr:MAG: hypothetical protein EYC59_03410 [Candidatus Saccharibacteria bacterium]
MVSQKSVEQQLKNVGCNFAIWGRAEIHELSNILMPDEIIAQAANGTYEGGFALICVTQYRVLLVDKKPMLLTVEDLRYDMIAEVDLHSRLLMSMVRIMTPMRNLVFSSWSHVRLRKCVNYIQQRVMELRQHGMGMTADQFQPQGQTPQGVPIAKPQYSSVVGGQQGAPRPMPMNPYTKVPMLSRRRRFPNFY